ncbi:MAG: EF-hand domain-containing protein [Alphaproteobacteria bacterium]
MIRPIRFSLGLAAGLLPAIALADSFAGLDRNGDGAVDRAEWSAASAERFAGLDANGDGRLNMVEIATIPVTPGPSAQRLRETRQREYQAMDADGDGEVSREEYLAVSLTRFQALDRNGDQRIAEAEVRSSGGRRGE